VATLVKTLLARKRKAPSTPATMSKQQVTLSKQHSTLLPQTATMSNDSIVQFRPFDNVECCFDVVAVFGNNVAGFGNNVEATFDTVEIIVQFVAFDNVASTLLLVWTMCTMPWYLLHGLLATIGALGSPGLPTPALFSALTRNSYF